MHFYFSNFRSVLFRLLASRLNRAAIMMAICYWILDIQRCDIAFIFFQPVFHFWHIYIGKRFLENKTKRNPFIDYFPRSFYVLDFFLRYLLRHTNNYDLHQDPPLFKRFLNNMKVVILLSSLI